MKLECALMVCVAQDTCQGKPIEDPVLVKKLLELSDSKTEHLPGFLTCSNTVNGSNISRRHY